MSVAGGPPIPIVPGDAPILILPGAFNPPLPANPPAPAAPVSELTREVCAAQLTLDWLHRKRGRWPLLGPEELTALRSHALVRPYSRELAISSTYYRSEFLNPVTNDEVRDRLVTQFPALPQLWELADGHILVAGGAAVDAMTGMRRASDCDIFFFGLSVDAASELLKRMVDHLLADAERKEVHRSQVGGGGGGGGVLWGMATLPPTAHGVCHVDAARSSVGLPHVPVHLATLRLSRPDLGRLRLVSLRGGLFALARRRCHTVGRVRAVLVVHARRYIAPLAVV